MKIKITQERKSASESKPAVRFITLQFYNVLFCPTFFTTLLLFGNPFTLPFCSGGQTFYIFHGKVQIKTLCTNVVRYIFYRYKLTFTVKHLLNGIC